MQNLYPNLDDLLGDWQADYRPPFEGIRVVGDRWSPDSHRTRDFLARNRVPYRWLDVEGSEEARRDRRERRPRRAKAAARGLRGRHLRRGAGEPGDRREDRAPDPRRAAVLRPASSSAEDPRASPPRSTGRRKGLKTVLVEREAPGGQAGTSSRIENYLGFPGRAFRGDLARRAVDQARRFEVEILTPQEVSAVRVEDPYRIVTLADGTEISCYALIITTGVSYRKLDAPGVERLTGRGVYYGAAQTEAFSCKDEDVYIVGGANSAGQAAMFFSDQARRVFLLCRGDDLRKSMSDYLVRQIEDEGQHRGAPRTPAWPPSRAKSTWRG